jgi:Arc/MetJ-type ribon-helix-helix transcriptional regulator
MDIYEILFKDVVETLKQEEKEETEKVQIDFPRATVSEKVQITLFLPESYVRLLKTLQNECGYKNSSTTMDALLKQLIDERKMPNLSNLYKEPRCPVIYAPENEELSLYINKHTLPEKMVNQSYTISSKYREKLKLFVEEMQYKSMSELMCEPMSQMIK